MPLSIRYQGGPRAGQVDNFADDQQEILFGRDATRCKVSFPPDDTEVGREHCAIMREGGGYRLQANGRNPVLLDGKVVVGHTNLDIDRECKLQLGRKGPIVLITPTLATSSKGKPLPPTAHREKTPGTMAAVMKSSSRARNALIAASIAFIIGGGALAVTKVYRDRSEQKFGETDEKLAIADRALGETSQRLDDTGKRIDATGKRIDVVEAKVASLATAVDDLAKLSAEQRTTLNALADDLKRTRGSVAEAAKAMQPSVYLVTIKTPDGNLRPLATAWVVDRKRGLLATNAHVAELHKQVSSYAADLPNDAPLVVCSPGENGHTFEVIDVTIHPGYDAFTKLWETFDPSRPLGSQALEPIANAGPACDVALLHVEPNDNLAPDLKLASDETIRCLSAGDPVAMAGYPLEGILLGGVNVKQPFSELDVGIVKAVTDFFGSPARDAELQLIHHSVASAGGASGSPIVNAAGEVVAVHNAANLFDCTVLDADSKHTSHVRVGSPSNIHYGQRIDLVRELLADANTRTSRQAQRAAEWKTRIAMFYKPGRLETARWALDDNARQLAKDLESSGEYTVQKTSLAKPQYSSTADATARQMMHRAELPLPTAGYYVVAALGQSGQPVSLVAKFAGQESRGSARSELASMSRTMLKVAKPGPLELVASTVPGDTPEFAVTRFVRIRRSADELHQTLADRWANSAGHEYEHVGDVNGTLSRSHEVGAQWVAASQFQFEPKAGGRYLVTLVGPDEGSLWLTIDAQKLKSDSPAKPGTYLSTSVDRTTSGPIKGLVVGDTAAVGYTMRLYRAKPTK